MVANGMVEQYRDPILQDARKRLTIGQDTGIIGSFAQIALSEMQHGEFPGVHANQEAFLRGSKEPLLEGLFTRATGVAPTREQQRTIEDLYSMYFALGERMAPFYAAVSDWIFDNARFQTQEHPTDPPVILFEGRDSFLIKLAFEQRHGVEAREMGIRSIAMPASRATISGFGVGTGQEAKRDEQKGAIIDWYQRNDLIGKHVIVADFGFHATISRLHQLVLAENGTPTQSYTALLAYRRTLLPLFDPQVRVNPDAFADPTAAAQLDAHNMNNVSGFFSTENQRQLDDHRALVALQELSGTLNEATEDALLSTRRISHQRSLAVVSAYELVARYAFLCGAQGAHVADIQTQTEDVVALIQQFVDFASMNLAVSDLIHDVNDYARSDFTAFAVFFGGIQRGKSLNEILADLERELSVRLGETIRINPVHT